MPLKNEFESVLTSHENDVCEKKKFDIQNRIKFSVLSIQRSTLHEKVCSNTSLSHNLDDMFASFTLGWE